MLSTSLAWPAVAGCSRAENLSQLTAISFAQPCTICAFVRNSHICRVPLARNTNASAIESSLPTNTTSRVPSGVRTAERAGRFFLIANHTHTWRRFHPLILFCIRWGRDTHERGNERKNTPCSDFVRDSTKMHLHSGTPSRGEA